MTNDFDFSSIGCENKLFKNLKLSLPELQTLFNECSKEWGYEDSIYRFYYHSFKVFNLQETTTKIVSALQGLSPDCTMSPSFLQIIKEGTGKVFKHEDNRNWNNVTRPIVEAFFHARYFLEMAVKYGNELQHPPQSLPSGWAALLCLYQMR